MKYDAELLANLAARRGDSTIVKACLKQMDLEDKKEFSKELTLRLDDFYNPLKEILLSLNYTNNDCWFDLLENIVTLQSKYQNNIDKYTDFDWFCIKRKVTQQMGKVVLIQTLRISTILDDEDECIQMMKLGDSSAEKFLDDVDAVFQSVRYIYSIDGDYNKEYEEDLKDLKNLVKPKKKKKDPKTFNLSKCQLYLKNDTLENFQQQLFDFVVNVEMEILPEPEVPVGFTQDEIGILYSGGANSPIEKKFLLGSDDDADFLPNDAISRYYSFFTFKVDSQSHEGSDKIITTPEPSSGEYSSKRNTRTREEKAETNGQKNSRKKNLQTTTSEFNSKYRAQDPLTLISPSAKNKNEEIAVQQGSVRRSSRVATLEKEIDKEIEIENNIRMSNASSKGKSRTSSSSSSNKREAPPQESEVVQKLKKVARNVVKKPDPLPTLQWEEQLSTSSNSSVVQGSSAKKIKQSCQPWRRTRWSDVEINALRRGILKHGSGEWRKILEDKMFSRDLRNRSNVDLKDKYRNMIKYGTESV